jgi:hypothetical protein
MTLFSRISYYWNEYGFEILFCLCLIFLIIGGLFQLGKKGTYSKYYFNPFDGKSTYTEKPQSQAPQKKDSTGETICRNYLEKRFNKSFQKARPNFLRNPVTGGDYNLELDCFNPELRLALEYNGAQHYKYIPYFHKNKEAFLNQKYRDEMKRVKCKENGIQLIEVPYTVKPHELEDYVYKELLRFGFK